MRELRQKIVRYCVCCLATRCFLWTGGHYECEVCGRRLWLRRM